MKTLPFNLLTILLFFAGSTYAQNPVVPDALFTEVDEMPRFSGCEDFLGTFEEKKHCAEVKLLEYIYGGLSYPAEARKLGIQGIAVVSFIIEKDGSVTSPRMLRTLGSGCDEEIIRIVNTMPKWIPGKHEGESVRVQFNLPVRFKLEEGDAPLPPELNIQNASKVKFPMKMVSFYIQNGTPHAYNIQTPTGRTELSAKSTQKITCKSGYKLIVAKGTNKKMEIKVSDSLASKEINLKKTLKAKSLVIN